MHQMVKTGSFELAVYSKGDLKSTRLAVVVPGRLDSKDYIHISSLVDYLADKGYYALAFDPPGTWESPGGIELYTMTNILKALNELIEYFGNKPTVLVGHSKGGKIAMLAGCANPHVTHFAAIMSHSGPTTVDLPKNEGENLISHRDLPPGTTRTKQKKRFDLPFSYFEDQQKYDALDLLKTCTKPKLFFYGIKDELMSKEVVQQLFNASAEPKEIREVISEHDYRLHPEVIAEVNQTIGEFFEKYS